jgi:hypothetical protein
VAEDPLDCYDVLPFAWVPVQSTRQASVSTAGNADGWNGRQRGWSSTATIARRDRHWIKERPFWGPGNVHNCCKALAMLKPCRTVPGGAAIRAPTFIVDK